MWLQNFWRKVRAKPAAVASVSTAGETPHPEHSPVTQVEIDPADPLLAYLQAATGVVQVDKVKLNSPALAAMQAAGIQLVAPLVNQGQLIGLLNVGARLSEQEYTSDDRRLLQKLVTQAAPAVRVAQLVQQQQLEARQRERIEQELRIARIIQETLLPKHLPNLPGWSVSAYWQPAQEVGGDFYDFIGLPDGRLGVVIGDVTGKGVPSALVMASTRSILRSAAEYYASPGQVLERVNNLLYPEIPAGMFVTCLYAIFAPASGHFWFANAGHNLPSQTNRQGVVELWARGMPLGLMPNMRYEEAETTLDPGDSILLYSDGLVEAHNPQREMFGFPRLRQILPQHVGDARMIESLKVALADFVGPNWVQEDDVTLVLLERQPLSASLDPKADQTAERLIASLTVASQPGNERGVTEQVATVVASEVALPQPTLERLKTAVAEAVMNAMEHGNHYDPEKAVEIAVRTTPQALTIAITDQGDGPPLQPATTPDLAAKLAGEQSPRGWGLFLIKNMVDELKVIDGERQHTVELIFHLIG